MRAQAELPHIFEGESSELERMRDFYPGCDRVHKVGLLAVCREAPNSAVPQIDYNFAEDLPAVVGGAQHVDSRLDEDVRAGDLRLDGFRRLEWANRNREEKERDDGQEDVGGVDRLHGWILC